MAIDVKQNLSYAPLQQIKVLITEDFPKHRCVNIVDGKFADAGDAMFGVSEISWDSGDFASFIVSGTAIVETSEAIAVGDTLMAANDGKVATRALAVATLGVAITACSLPGYIVATINPVPAVL